jgi:glycosyltransferase involved in cell wall biosynthesis
LAPKDSIPSSEKSASRPLRIAFISTMPPDRGNLAEYGGHFSRALSQCDGVERVDVLANIVPNAPEHESIAPGLNVRRVWRLNSSWSIRNIVRHAQSLQPDIVHLNAGIRTWGRSKSASLFGAELPMRLRQAGLHVVTTLHTIGDTVRLDQLNIGPLTRWGMHLASWLYLKSHAVTVTLVSMQHALEDRFGASNVAHIPHGTYGARVNQVPFVQQPRILTFGFWGAFKDADLLISAVQTLRREGLPAELVLGGGAHPYFPEIYHRLVQRYQALPFVRFTGYLPEHELTELFTSVSVVVLPYRTNAGASGVLNLCRSYGRPVIISNEPGLLEQLRHEGGSGLVFDNQASLVDALKQVLTQPELQQKMGEANLRVAHQMNIATQANEVVKLLRRVCAEGQLNTPSTERPSHTLASSPHIIDKATLVSSAGC